MRTRASASTVPGPWWRYHVVQGETTGAFTTLDVASDWVCANPVLVEVWALDQSRTTVDMSALHRRWLSNQLIKISVVELLHGTALVCGKGKMWAGHAGAVSVAEEAMPAAAANQVCRNPYAPLGRRKSHDDNDSCSCGHIADDDTGPTGQGGHAYKITVRCLP